jgi:4-hydroxybenzoate polyprenyltransferase
MSQRTLHVKPGVGLASKPGVLRRLRLCLVEARPSVQLMFALRFLSGGALVVHTGSWARWPRLSGFTLSLLAWVLATLYTYLINGAMDVREDRVNRLARPIGRGALDPATARVVATLCAVLALLCGLASGTAVAALVAVFLGLGYAYSVPPLRLSRNTVGAATVIILGGILTYCAGHLAMGLPPTLSTVVFGVAMSLWMGLVGAVVKDLSDVRGDIAAGRRTLTTRVREAALRRGVAVVAVALGAAFVGTAAALTPRLLAPAVVVLAGACCVAYFALTTHSTDGRRHSRRPYRAFMVTQYLAHVALLAVVS